VPGGTDGGPQLVRLFGVYLAGEYSSTPNQSQKNH